LPRKQANAADFVVLQYLAFDSFKFPSAPHLLMIVPDADDVVRAKELPVWPLDRATSCLAAEI
jgi:hypothetical protein